MRSQRKRPPLKQFAKLRRSDFVRSPVWVACHVLDYDEPWHGETNEETFRPYDEDLPFDPKVGMALVSAVFSLPDGTSLYGFVTPLPARGLKGPLLKNLPDIAHQQPHVFIPGGRQLGFWWGMMTPPLDYRSRAYASLRRTPAEVFPMTFSSDRGLTLGKRSGRIDGFCYASDLRTAICLP
jgi:hypothetical protein